MKNKQLIIEGTKTGEYIPAAEVIQPAAQVVHQKRGCLTRLFSSFIWLFVIIMLVFFGLMFGRQWYDSLLARLDYNKTVHPDESIVETGIRSQVRPTITLVYEIAYNPYLPWSCYHQLFKPESYVIFFRLHYIKNADNTVYHGS